MYEHVNNYVLVYACACACAFVCARARARVCECTSARCIIIIYSVYYIVQCVCMRGYW